MCVLKALDSRFGSPGRLRFELTFCVLVRFGHFLTFCVLSYVLVRFKPIFNGITIRFGLRFGSRFESQRFGFAF